MGYKEIKDRFDKATAGPWTNGHLVKWRKDHFTVTDERKKLLRESPDFLMETEKLIILKSNDTYVNYDIESLSTGETIVGMFDYEDGGVVRPEKDAPFIANSWQDTKDMLELLKDLYNAQNAFPLPKHLSDNLHINKLREFFE